MSDVEQELRRALDERIGSGGLRPAPLARSSRRSIRRRRTAMVLSAAAVVVAGVAAVAAFGDRTAGVVMDRDMGVIAPRLQTGTSQERVWDGDVAFELVRLDCGHGQFDDLDPEGNLALDQSWQGRRESVSSSKARFSFCSANLVVINESSRELVVPPSEHVLTAGGRRFPPWDRAMAKRAADDPGSALTTPIPPGGAATFGLAFEYPSELEPERLEVHAAEGSPGAVFVLDDCEFVRHEGRVSGGCYRERARAELGVPYPHRISGSNGGMSLYTVCFDERQWEVVEPHPTAVSREGFAGHGYMTLESARRAIYEDNSGVVLRLEPTELNEGDPGLCG